MFRLALLCLAMAGAVLAAPFARAAEAGCTLAKYAELPVTMVGMRPMVTVKINGQEVRFFIDSGAFFSSMSLDAAKRLGLPVTDAPYGFRVVGVGGTETPRIATVKNFEVGPIALTHVEFLTTPSPIFDASTIGLIGQNLLFAADVEYDLANGVVRLFKPGKGCRDAARAYWSKTYSELRIEPTTPLDPHLVADVIVNGHKFRAVFDTGAAVSALSLRAAGRIDITPKSAGLTASGLSGGIGPRRFETWITPVDSFSVGDETIQKTRLRIGDMELGNGTDMLLGPDFFLSHRIYVAKDQNRIYMTYNGGPVFNLNASGPSGGPSTATPRTDVAASADAGPTDAGGFSRRAAAYAARREFTAAIADYSRAVELEPKVAQHLYDRAVARLSNREPVLAMADLGEALQLKPDYAEALITRGIVYLNQRDEGRARTDFDAALKLAQPGSTMELAVAGAYERTMHFETAVSHYDSWIGAHPQDQQMAAALNARCWTRSLWNHDLDKAVADCDAALKLQPHNTAFLDSRGLAKFRLGQFDRAIADYDEALKLQPKLAWSMYVRGLAKLKKGAKAEGDADIAAAVAIDASIMARARQYGLLSGGAAGPAGAAAPIGAMSAPPAEPPPAEPRLPIVVKAPNANPDWLIRPTQAQSEFFYPLRAQRAQIPGVATVQCKVDAHGTASDCQAISENPAEFGFGAAAVQIVTRYAQFSPKIVDGAIVDGATIKAPIYFKVRPTNPAPPAAP